MSYLFAQYHFLTQLILGHDHAEDAKVFLVSFGGKPVFRLNSQLLYFIPRDNIVQYAELQRKTEIEYAPESRQADEYRTLARAIDANTFFTVPTPLANDELEALLIQYLPIS